MFCAGGGGGGGGRGGGREGGREGGRVSPADVANKSTRQWIFHGYQLVIIIVT